MHLRQDHVDLARPGLPAQAALDADARRGALLGLLAPDLQVAELGVGHQPSVDEQRRADSGAERHDQHRSVTSATRAHAHLGKTGGIGVVQKRHRPVDARSEQRPGVGADPASIDVRRRHRHALTRNRRKREPDRTRGRHAARDVREQVD